MQTKRRTIMSMKKKYWEFSLIVIILGVGALVFHHLIPFMGGLLGALAVYTLVRKQMFHLSDTRHMRRSLAASLITAEATLCFLVPMTLGVWLTVSGIQHINLDPQKIIVPLEDMAHIIRSKTGYNLLSNDTLTMMMSSLPKIGQTVMDGISSFIVNMLVLIFVLYFMLIGGRDMERYIYDILPFETSDKQKVLSEMKVVIRSNTIGLPLLAVTQSLVAVLGYWIFDAPNLLLLGLLTCVSTLLPVIGTALVWAPVSLYLGLTGQTWQAIGLAAYGLIIISQSDNLIRLIIQKQMADTHPLITIFGVVIGFPIFGFMGVIFGPLLLSLFLLCANMFKRKYLDQPTPASSPGNSRKETIPTLA